MHQTRAWLFAFRQAFKATYDAPQPPNDDNMLNLLHAADERLDAEDHEDEDADLPPASPKPSHH